MKKKRKNEGKGFRIEKDILGKVNVPADAFYGIQTVRAAGNFPISHLRINHGMNDAILLIKMAAAQANVKCRLLNPKIGNVIVRACVKILAL